MRYEYAIFMLLRLYNGGFIMLYSMIEIKSYSFLIALNIRIHRKYLVEKPKEVHVQ